MQRACLSHVKQGRVECVESYHPIQRMNEKPNALDMLDDTIEAIQMHRDSTGQNKAEINSRLNAAWAGVIKAAEELRPRLTADPRLRYLTIRRDGLALTVSFSGKTPASRGDLLEMSRHHPEGQFQETQAIWVRETDKDERRVTDPDDAVKTLVRFCARNLTRQK